MDEAIVDCVVQWNNKRDLRIGQAGDAYAESRLLFNRAMPESAVSFAAGGQPWPTHLSLSLSKL